MRKNINVDWGQDRTLTRRSFLLGIATGAAAAVAPAAVARSVERLRHDPDLTVLLADIHINGKKDGEHYQPGELRKTIEEILTLDPLPARVVFFGDLARSNGCVADYTLARQCLQPLVDAGIALHLGMGNHDAHNPFFEVFPEYGRLTRVPGEVVFTVDAGAVDFIMLDILGGDRKTDGSCLSRAQQDWLAEALPRWKKPVFVCSHYATWCIDVGGRNLSELLVESPMVAGYIHGHDHRWRKDFVHLNWKSPRIVKTLCLPSTGHWGDIGWALLRTRGGQARVSLRQRDFWFPIKDSPEPGADLELWRLNTLENKGATCTFTLPTA